MKATNWLAVLLVASVATWTVGCGGDSDKGKDSGTDSGKKSDGDENVKTSKKEGGASDWDAQPISLYGRNSSSGTYGFFKEVALGGGDYKSSVKEQPGTSAVVQGVGADKYAMGYSGIGGMTPDVRAVPLAVSADAEAYAPTAENADDYPLTRFLLLTVNYEPNSELPPLQREFLKYVFSKQGQQDVLKDGYLPVPAVAAREQLARVGIMQPEVEVVDDEESGVDPALPEYTAVPGVSGTLKSEGSDTMNNMMALWGEGFNKFYPDVKLEVVGKGSSTAIPALIAGTATFGPMSRAAKAEEIDEFEEKYGYKPTQLGTSLDMLAVYVNKDNPIEKLTLPQVDAIFSQNRKLGLEADIAKWGDIE